MKAAIGFCAIALLTWSEARAAPPVLTPVTAPPVSRDFAGEKDKPSTDMSGVVCRGGGRTRFCVFVDDQTTFVQPATLRDYVLTPAKPVAVLPDRPPADAFGEPPSPTHCPAGEASFKDLDGEALALSGSRLYVMGSHGCGRKSEKFRSSSFVVARMSINGQNKIGKPQQSYRLSEALWSQPALYPYFTQSLMSANGLTLEGMTIRGDDLLFGLRAPSLNGKAYILSVPSDVLFSKQILTSELTEIALGEERGVRDLVALPDGMLLVLSGPAQEQDVPYEIVLFDQAGAELRRAQLAPEQGPDGPGKAEGMTVLDRSKDALRVLIVFDGLKNGGPREYRFPLR